MKLPIQVTGALLISISVTATNSGVQKPAFLPGASTVRITSLTPRSLNLGLMPAAPEAPHAVAAIVKPAATSEVLETYSQFDSWASMSQGLVKGAAVKFLIDNRVSPAKIHFINGNFLDDHKVRPDYVQFHYYFAKAILGVTLSGEDFNAQTYFTNDPAKKKFIAGTLQSYEYVAEGAPKKILGVQFYPQDAIAEETVLSAVKVVRKAVKFEDLPMAFISYGSQQTVKKVSNDLLDLKIQPMGVDEIYAGIPFIPMQNGSTMGILRFQPKGEALDRLSPSDIPVFDELPLDLSVVAGVITTVIQDAGAHVNLKSKERKTPNMVLKDPEEIARLKSLDNKPVRLLVSDDKYVIVDSVTEEQVKKFHLDILKNKKSVKIENGKDTDVSLFDTMAKDFTATQIAAKAMSYGGKASRLALMASPSIVGMGSPIQKSLGYRITPMGFGVPIVHYFDFLKANPSLKEAVDHLINKEMGLNGQTQPSPEERKGLVAEIQKMFYSAVLPDSLVKMVTLRVSELKKLAATFYPQSPLKKVKVRSSSNAEDIPKFDGAGLHSSYSAKLDVIGNPAEPCQVVISEDGVSTKEEMDPESVLCGIKGVYASLWNKRAIEERNFARIDQRTAGMALAVNGSYDFRKKTEKIEEIANAVVVTRVINSQGVYGYRISVNTKDNLVTNPTPGTQSEIAIAGFLGLKEVPTFSFIQYAKVDAVSEVRKEPLLVDFKLYSRIIEIARRVEFSYCRAVPSYYPNGNCNYLASDLEKPSSLDMEFKIFSNGEVMLKQMREFSGR